MKMKIGFVMMESIYPQRGGIHEQVYLLLRELHRRGYDAEIVAYSKRNVDQKGRRLLWLRQNSPAFISKISKYDIVISETVWPIIPSLISSKIFHKKCILHLHSIESKQDVGLSLLGKSIITFFEKLSVFCDIILVPSKIEQKLLKSSKVKILPNIIDIEAFNLYKPIELKRPAVVFVGGMGYPPNREAAEFIVRISEKLKNMGKYVNFYLVGPSPPKVSPPVYTTEYVESTIPFILSADICIAPLKRGGGVKLKVLEYMAAGKPIIATKKAVEGIDNIKYINAETEDEFINGIVEILSGKIDLNFTENKDIILKNHTSFVAGDILEKIIKDL
ncbi:glycosyltransferase family 4 protein [Saccharolobus islandicus]|uniref:Glycosyltransferase group 1 n=1 Tax=Saccharolobus islandicus (strain HVE10/4) TaxID=930943 RepID=F0NJH8_SACI0|nr:glycosyltransferase family 4 protein [Sulfolobus islandicus]ADX81843.1 glycosyltransferase group 1 [Sulfolobus islandicus HVE10/4]